ncbi:MAG: hypothetical protein IJ003_04835 [Candidatus Gastranaerophilales bacterium]|nr:hypothetical protein [Candidatus Gastranaerophilales bacterium]
MLIFTTIINLISSYLIASISCEFLVIFIAFFALVVLNLEILSLFNAINPLNITFLSIFFAIVISLFFKFKKAKFLKIKINFKRIKNSFLLDKSLLIMFFAFLSLLLVSFFLAVVTSVLEPDSQTYHFLRAYEYIKNSSLNHFETTDIRALIMPINSEILYSYMLAFKKNFFGYGIVSFVSYIVCLISSWQICEIFKFSYRKRFWAIFLFSSLSAIIVQIPSLQTDILVGALLLTSFYLYLKEKNYFSSLSLALALGVKTTGFIALFGFFVLVFGYEILINKKFKNLMKFFGFLGLNFLIFSSYNYFSNFIHYGNFFSNNAAYIGHCLVGGFKGYIANIINFIFQAFDFTGFKWGYYLNSEIIGLRENVFNFLNIEENLRGNVPMQIVNIFTDEQFVGFGILGFALFVPSVFIAFVKGFLNKNKKTLFLALLACVFLINILCLAASVAYMVYSIRFVVAFVCLSFLVLIVTYKKRFFLKSIIVFFALFYMIFIPLNIKRMPVFKLFASLKKNNYNLEKLSHDLYRGATVSVLEITPKVYDILETKYKNCKKIAYIRGTQSSVLYLKLLENKERRIDFLNIAYLNDEKLKEYDLVILEKEKQDDNVFALNEVNPKYEIKNNNIVFDSNQELYCYYENLELKATINPYLATKRICFGYPYLKMKKYLKLDYIDSTYVEDFDETVNIYYFINQIKD